MDDATRASIIDEIFNFRKRFLAVHVSLGPDGNQVESERNIIAERMRCLRATLEGFTPDELTIARERNQVAMRIWDEKQEYHYESLI